MKNTLTALTVVLAGLSWSVAPRAQAADKAKKGALLVPAADIKWNDVPDMAGVQLAAVDGDPSKGPSHFFIKFVGGFSAPVHHHTANHFVTVVSGTLVLTVDGNEQKLPPGSFFAFSRRPNTPRPAPLVRTACWRSTRAASGTCSSRGRRPPRSSPSNQRAEARGRGDSPVGVRRSPGNRRVDFFDGSHRFFLLAYTGPSRLNLVPPDGGTR